MTKGDLFPAWRRILSGGKPLLSVEITKECPLRCPGCYAFEPEHLGDAGPLRLLSDYRGQTLVDGFLSLVRKQRPIHVSIVGGEPLVRYRELDEILPRLERMGIEVQLVTSAVRAIPSHWAELRNLHLVVSIDGLQPEHDRRRAPATYDRIQKHIAGHMVIVHCTVTRQMLARSGYLEDFTRFWSEKPEVRKVWFSLFTPQEGSGCAERLEPADRLRVLSDLAALRPLFPKVHLPEIVLRGLENPPQSPEECIFAQTTTCVSADFTTRITPCQFGGQPVCAECGCLASAGLAAIGRVRLGGLVSVAQLFSASRKFGHAFAGKDAA
ncbi:MAG: radical SAM protein [Bryobacterales bacterium]|nr:radical SAM protein [Bryobacterales bacterium]